MKQLTQNYATTPNWQQERKETTRGCEGGWGEITGGGGKFWLEIQVGMQILCRGAKEIPRLAKKKFKNQGTNIYFVLRAEKKGDGWMERMGSGGGVGAVKQVGYTEDIGGEKIVEDDSMHY